MVNCFFLERIQFEWVLEKATKVNEKYAKDGGGRALCAISGTISWNCKRKTSG